MEQFIGMYKAKRCDGKGWVQGSLLEPTTDRVKTQIIAWNGTRFDVIPETVCQFTGVHDMNKVKVFSGDQFDYCGETRHVEYIEDLCRFVLTTGFGYDTRNCVDLDCDVVYKREIIGNIYDENN